VLFQVSSLCQEPVCVVVARSHNYNWVAGQDRFTAKRQKADVNAMANSPLLSRHSFYAQPIEQAAITIRLLCGLRSGCLA
jgi:hypothetical protein